MKRSGLEYLKGSSKRRLDVIGGSALAFALLPAGTVAAIASGIDNRSIDPFFTQTRIGRSGRPLQIRKLRTIPQRSTREQPETFGTYDPRASAIGLALREFGIDEMPQLINVLKGEMSLVGLRPLLPVTLEMMEDASPRLYQRWRPYYDEIKPALAGPSQILRHWHRVEDGALWQKVMKLDLEYIRYATLWNDIKILGSTPIKLLNAKVNAIDSESTEREVPSEVPRATPI